MVRGLRLVNRLVPYVNYICISITICVHPGDHRQQNQKIAKKKRSDTCSKPSEYNEYNNNNNGKNEERTQQNDMWALKCPASLVIRQEFQLSCLAARVHNTTAKWARPNARWLVSGTNQRARTVEINGPARFQRINEANTNKMNGIE